MIVQAVRFFWAVLDEIQDQDFAGELVFLFTVQEEVGLRGAQTAMNGLAEVDMAIAIDTTAVSDTPEEMMDQSLRLGAGTGIKVMDFSLIVQKSIKDTLKNHCTGRKHSLPIRSFPRHWYRWWGSCIIQQRDSYWCIIDTIPLCPFA